MSCWRDSPSRSPLAPLLPEAQQGRQGAERWPASCWLPWALALALLCVCQAAGGMQGCGPLQLVSRAGVAGWECKVLLKGQQVVEKKAAAFQDAGLEDLEGPHQQQLQQEQNTGRQGNKVLA